jgi:hypothetical protein
MVERTAYRNAREGGRATGALPALLIPPAQAYRSSASTDELAEFACARAAMPLWLRML